MGIQPLFQYIQKIIYSNLMIVSMNSNVFLKNTYHWMKPANGFMTPPLKDKGDLFRSPLFFCLPNLSKPIFKHLILYFSELIEFTAASLESIDCMLHNCSYNIMWFCWFLYDLYLSFAHSQHILVDQKSIILNSTKNTINYWSCDIKSE